MGGDEKCGPGCRVYFGGERKHHTSCVHYPESLTKLYEDRIRNLERDLKEAREKEALHDELSRGKVFFLYELAIVKRERETAVAGLEQAKGRLDGIAGLHGPCLATNDLETARESARAGGKEADAAIKAAGRK